jgi:predicted Zn-dependent peptidase
MVLEQQIAVDTEGGIQYPVGDLFDYNGPTLMVTRILHKPEYSADQTIAAYDEILEEMKQTGITSEELEPIKVKFRSNYFSRLEGGASIPRYGLMHLLACFTLFDNDPQLVNSVLGGFMEVTPEAVQSVAHKLLTRNNRSIVIRQPVMKGAA